MSIVLEFLYFVTITIFCFYIPGRVIFHLLKIDWKGIEEIFMTTSAGIVFFISLLYVLSWVHFVWLAWPVLIVCAFIALKYKLLHIKLTPNEYKLLALLIIFAIVFSLPLSLYSISHYRFDDLWHLALINELKVQFPPEIPTYAGVPLKGYHFFSDFLLAKMSQLFYLSPFNLFFVYGSFLLCLLWAFGTYTLMQVWSKRSSIALWAVFLTMFGGSFAYFFHWFGHPEINLQNGLRMLQPATSIINPPFVLSVSVLFFCLILLHTYLKTHNKGLMILFIFAAGILPMIKVYAGIILYSGFLIIVMYEMIKKRYFLLITLLGVAIIFLCTYGVFVLGYGSLLWYPLWPSHQLLGNISGAGFEEKIATYYKVGVISKILPIELLGIFLFLFANLGTRLLGILVLLIKLKTKPKPGIFVVSLLVMLITSVCLPLFFIQTGKVFEMIQMTNYYLLLASLFAAFGINTIITSVFAKNKLARIFVSIIIIAFTIPSAVVMLSDTQVYARSTNELATSYINALDALKNHGSYDDTVIEFPPLTISRTTTDIAQWIDSSQPLIPVLANKRTYLADGGIIFPGMDLDARVQTYILLLKYSDSSSDSNLNKVKNILTVNKIRYIISPYPMPKLVRIKNIKEIYNKGYYIYEYQITKNI